MLIQYQTKNAIFYQQKHAFCWPKNIQLKKNLDLEFKKKIKERKKKDKRKKKKRKKSKWTSYDEFSTVLT